MSTLVTSDLIQDALENPEVVDITLYTDWKPERVKEVTYHASIYLISGNSIVLEAKDFGTLVVNIHTYIEKYTKRTPIILNN